MRAIVFLLFIVLVYFIARFTLNRIIEIREKQRQERLKQEQQNNATEKPPEEMVRCALCGVHLPQAEAYFDGKDTFCSEGHMKQYHEQQNQK
ncbi:PP0621 family protein [Thiomicrorhabdus sp. Kp2]|uniref:PP0621 family protein n=1 Tax=Thiomicrorhabdus sp. Kp2 TaxID=1123518 RepID=UPI00041BFFD7|nr:PP0621 family protein [Thiomicrorhabdus sp. Kp2]